MFVLSSLPKAIADKCCSLSYNYWNKNQKICCFQVIILEPSEPIDVYFVNLTEVSGYRNDKASKNLLNTVLYGDRCPLTEDIVLAGVAVGSIYSPLPWDLSRVSDKL